jgi:hypothetical protein
LLADTFEPIAATFGSGSEDMPTGECVFTAPSVQQAILDWFTEVASNPSTYKNPEFEVKIGENRLDEPVPQDPALITAQAALEQAQHQLKVMKAALEHTPADIQALARGRDLLERRIGRKESDIVDLQRKVDDVDSDLAEAIGLNDPADE